MTSIVGAYCTDGVVIGADGLSTFVAGARPTMQQPTEKIEIVKDRVLVTSSGSVGLAQRLEEVARIAWSQNSIRKKRAVAIGKNIANRMNQDIASTEASAQYFSALIAYPAAGGELALCELAPAPDSKNLQPEWKTPNDNWFVTIGGGQFLTDPFIGFLRSTLWNQGAPDLNGGIFTVLWALLHACELSPGGVGEPISMAVLRKDGVATKLTSEDLEPHRELVKDAIRHMADFRDLITGVTEGVPEPPQLPSSIPR